MSYTVVVEADNPGRRSAAGHDGERRDRARSSARMCCGVPNTALRFRPADPEIAARGQAHDERQAAARGEARGQRGEGARGERGGRGQRGEGGQGGQGRGGGGRGVEQLAEQLELTEAQQAHSAQPRSNKPCRRPDRARPRGGTRRTARVPCGACATPRCKRSNRRSTARQRQLLAQMRAGGGPRAEVRRQAVVWVLRNNKPTPVQVEIGVADNGHTLAARRLATKAMKSSSAAARARKKNSAARSAAAVGGGGGPRIRGT